MVKKYDDKDAKTSTKILQTIIDFGIIYIFIVLCISAYAIVCNTTPLIKGTYEDRVQLADELSVTPSDSSLYAYLYSDEVESLSLEYTNGNLSASQYLYMYTLKIAIIMVFYIVFMIFLCKIYRFLAAKNLNEPFTKSNYKLINSSTNIVIASLLISIFGSMLIDFIILLFANSWTFTILPGFNTSYCCVGFMLLLRYLIKKGISEE